MWIQKYPGKPIKSTDRPLTVRRILWNYNEGTVFNWHGKIASMCYIGPFHIYLLIQFPFTKCCIRLSFTCGG